jgi:hypothetical protein
VIERGAVSLIVGGDDMGVPLLTRPMLDLWVHALHGGNPFLIVGRPGDDCRFVQTYRNGPGDFTLQYRDGADAEVMSAEVRASGVVVDAIWGWIDGDRTALERIDGWEPAG